MISASILFSRLIAKARLRQLHIILLVAELGTIQKAADAAGLSQPATTHALADVEELLNTKLFERHARGMTLTPVGRVLLPLIRSALAALRAGAYSVSAMQNSGGGLIRIGATSAGVSGLLSHALPSFTTTHPERQFRVHECEAEAISDLLAQGRIDLALCRTPVDAPKNAAFSALMQDRFVVIAAANHPLAKSSEVTIQELAQHSWAQPPTDTIVSPTFADMWVAADRQPKICQIDTRSALLSFSLIQRHQLLDMMPRSLATTMLDTGMFVELNFRVPGGELPDLGVLYYPGDSTEHAQEFISYLDSHCAEKA
jgi:DNA-binding transcriptional LysR family regulator